MNCEIEYKFKSYSYEHKYCSDKCNREHKKTKSNELFNQRYNDWLEGRELPLKFKRGIIRQFVILRDGYKCRTCGIDSWNGKPISLWTDHIDGDATNNSADNFRLVCPNCDSQSPTFGSKNNGNGRKSRGLPQYG